MRTESLEQISHCVAKIREIVDRASDDRRSVLQLGYNLGRLSELTRLGRGRFWDRWKGPAAAWNTMELVELARELAAEAETWSAGASHREAAPDGGN